MKIISTPSNIFKCTKCETEAEFENSDIFKKVDHPSYDEFENRISYYVSCPICKTKYYPKLTQFQKECGDMNYDNKTL